MVRKPRTFSLRKFIVLLILAILVELFVYYRFPKQPYIDGLMESWFMSQGLVMYKDFANQYFPLLFMLLVPFHKVFGFSQTPTLLLAPITSILAIVLLSAFSLKILSGWFRLIPLIFFLFWDTTLSENHFTVNSYLGIINLLIFITWLRWYKAPDIRKTFILGFLISLSFLSQQMMLVLGLLIGVSLVFRIIKDRQDVKLLFSFILALIAPSVLVFLFLLSQDALKAFYFWNVRWYLIKGYPFSSFGHSFDNTLILLSVSSPSLILVTDILFSLSPRRLNKRRLPKGYKGDFLLFMLPIVIILPISFWFAIFHMSRLQIILPLMSLVLGLSIQILFRDINKPRDAAYIIVVVLLLNVLSFFRIMVPKYQSNLERSTRTNIITQVIPGSDMDRAIKWVKENTPRESRLFALDTSQFYIEANRLPSSARATSNLPFVYVPIEDFKKELQDNPPDYWVIDENQWKRFREFGYSQMVILFQNMLECEQVAVRFGDLTIRQHNKDRGLCL